MLPTAPRTRSLSLLALVVLLAVACGSGGGVDTVRVQRPDVEVAPTPSPVPTYQHPITGEIYEGPQDWQGRPALAIKVENSRASRPQSGLDKADVVYEELAEGGITRFIAVFHTQGADVVGPVRSARMVDTNVLAPIGGLFGYSGAVPPVISAVRAVPGITDVGVDVLPESYYRRSGRRAPHNLYTSTDNLWRGRDGGPPKQQFSFIDAEGLAQGGVEGPPQTGKEGGTVSFSFASNGDPIRYVFDPDAAVYRRYHGPAPHTVEDGTHIGVTNLIIQRVGTHQGGSVDVAGVPSVEADVIGSGEAILLSGGRAIEGRWTRSSMSEPTQFTDASGQPLLLAPGRTWVELLPSDRSVRIDP